MCAWMFARMRCVIYEFRTKTIICCFCFLFPFLYFQTKGLNANCSYLSWGWECDVFFPAISILEIGASQSARKETPYDSFSSCWHPRMKERKDCSFWQHVTWVISFVFWFLLFLKWLLRFSFHSFSFSIFNPNPNEN